MEGKSGAKSGKSGTAQMSPRAQSTAVLEDMRSRHVQAEMRLRELEDRFRRDCVNQERELDVLKVENNKLRAKIEEYRMAECAPKAAYSENTADAPEIKFATKKYRSARESVERSRAELLAIQSKLTTVRHDIQETRRQRGVAHLQRRDSQMELERNWSGVKMLGEASRLRLRGLEYHVETESDRVAELMESAKDLRREIDVQLNIQGRSDDAYRDRERELTDVNNEISFLTEVCTVLFEERDETRETLKQMQRNAEEESAAYEKVLQEFLGVEDYDKENKARLQENIKKLQNELMEVTAERKQMEKTVESEKDSPKSRSGRNVGGKQKDRVFASTEEEDAVIGLETQLGEFEKYFRRFCDLVGSDDMLTVKNFVCNSSEERFQLYTNLDNVQQDVRECEQERKRLFPSDAKSCDATEDDCEARAELQTNMEELQRLQKEINDEEERTNITIAQLDTALPIIRELFTRLDCDDSAIAAAYGVNAISHESVCAFLSALEERFEEYMALWLHVQQANTGAATPPSASQLRPFDPFLLKGFGQPVSALKRAANVSDAEEA